MSLCRCGHQADTHLHYRDGTDCGQCGAEKCGAYVPGSFTDDQALGYLALAPYALPSDHIPEDPVTSSEPRTFTTDDGDEYVHVDPAELPDFDDVDATTIADPSAAVADGLPDGGEH